MKLSSIKASIAAGALAFASSGQAATIDSTDIFVNILKDGLSGDSMLVNTDINAGDLINGTLSSFTSDSAMTSAINNFIAGASSVEFYVVGSFSSGFDAWGLSNKFIDQQAAVGTMRTTIEAFITDANFGLFGFDTNGDGDFWEANIPAGDPIHYDNANIFGNGFADGFGLDTFMPMTASQTGFFSGVNEIPLGDFMLSSNGELTYTTGGASPVPVPAAVWLFGSGIVGLVGIARRRKSL